LASCCDRDDFQHYVAFRPGLGGLFAEREFANYIVINGDMPFESVGVAVFHEYTHFIHRSTATMQMPPWFTEGYAELFSSFRMNSQNQIFIGEYPSGTQLDADRSVWMPIERVLGVSMHDREYTTERLAPQFYGEAWALVHLLLWDEPKLRLPAEHYLRDMDLGVPEAEAFSRNFAFDKATLDERVRTLIKHGTIKTTRLTYTHPITTDDAPLARMTAPEADAQLARLAFAIGRPPGQVDTLVAAALKARPDDLGVRALAARVGNRPDQPMDLAPLRAALSAATSVDARARIDLAAALLADALDDGRCRQATQLLQPLVEADTPAIEAVVLWARAMGCSDGDPRRIRSVLERASPRVPHNSEVLMLLARASEIMDDRPAARRYYESIMLVSRSPEQRLWAQKQADSARLQRQ
jgi:hypothetical protein